ncbi:uncharacterized protein [Prorops nasuta]|uniref:uncharacterized protein n=1 Tax=Prorops nasuta TaxID=863751 RepID=UPI0034CF8DE7
MEGTGMINGAPVHQEGKKLWQYLSAFSACLLAVGVGTALAWTSPVLPRLKNQDSELLVTEDQGSWVGSLLAIGAMVGAIPAGGTADKLGRKKAMLLLAVPFLLSWILIVAAYNVWFLYIARFIVGIGVGASCVIVPAYVSEIAEISSRGTLGAFFQLFLAIGILFAFVFGAVLSYTVFSIVCAVVELLFLATFVWMPESPLWLISQNRKHDAVEALSRLRGDSYDPEEELSVMQKVCDESAGAATSIFHLLRLKGTQLALVAILGCMAFQQLSGVNAVIFYTFTIFEDTGNALAKDAAPIMVALVQMIMAVVAAVIVDKTGRKPLLMFSSGVMSISLVALGYYFHLMAKNSDNAKSIIWLPITSIIFYMIAFSVGLGPVPWMLMGELFTTETKAVASGVAVMVNWFLAFIVTKTFPSMRLQMGIYGAFWIFAAIMAIATVFELFLVPETKGKTLQQIQDELNGKMAETIEKEEYPLHKCIFHGDVKMLSSLIRTHDISQKDKQGNTPLHLAIMLGRKECVQLLLAHGAPLKVKNLAGWSPLAEAVSYGDRQTISSLVRKMKQKGTEQMDKRRPKLIAALRGMGDFSMELKWDFQSWVPLVSRILPSDICRIHKCGASIRMDTTLVDFNDMRWERGDISFIFNGEQKPSESLIVLDNRAKIYQKVRREETELDIEDEVDMLMSTDNMTAQMSTKGITFSRAQTGWIFKEDRTEMVGPFHADFYQINGIVLESKKRREHLSEEDIQKNKAITDSLTKGSSQILTNGEPPTRRTSLNPPPESNITWEEYIAAAPGESPLLGRDIVYKECNKSFKATVAMSLDFPLTVEMLLNVLEFTAPFKHMSKLRHFVRMKLPPGFPVKIDIPILPTVSAKITFQKFEFRNDIDPELFQVPTDYFEDPTSYRNADDKEALQWRRKKKNQNAKSTRPNGLTRSQDKLKDISQE